MAGWCIRDDDHLRIVYRCTEALHACDSDLVLVVTYESRIVAVDVLDCSVVVCHTLFPHLCWSNLCEERCDFLSLVSISVCLVVCNTLSRLNENLITLRVSCAVLVSNWLLVECHVIFCDRVESVSALCEYLSLERAYDSSLEVSNCVVYVVPLCE